MFSSTCFVSNLTKTKWSWSQNSCDYFVLNQMERDMAMLQLVMSATHA